jgi:hypothetical protein
MQYRPEFLAGELRRALQLDEMRREETAVRMRLAESLQALMMRASLRIRCRMLRQPSAAAAVITGPTSVQDPPDRR